MSRVSKGSSDELVNIMPSILLCWASFIRVLYDHIWKAWLSSSTKETFTESIANCHALRKGLLLVLLDIFE